MVENGNLAMDILEDLEQGTRMNQQQTQPTCYASSKNGTWARAVEYEPSHHCAIPTIL